MAFINVLCDNTEFKGLDDFMGNTNFNIIIEKDMSHSVYTNKIFPIEGYIKWTVRHSVLHTHEAVPKLINYYGGKTMCSRLKEKLDYQKHKGLGMDRRCSYNQEGNKLEIEIKFWIDIENYPHWCPDKVLSDNIDYVEKDMNITLTKKEQKEQKEE